ncbi:BclA C-terminal domain-containing protein [Sporosarcina psychrophila]|uniref:BclA C-terminal domain-containing protein n=1 Tax=Sporosarcina TaxID=1569 RepID=UPI0030FD70CA
MGVSYTIGGTILVLLGVPAFPPTNQCLDGSSMNGANTIFTIHGTDHYHQTYQVTTTVSLLAGARLMLNGIS